MGVHLRVDAEPTCDPTQPGGKISDADWAKAA